jgi:hypothetical protein
MSYWKTVKAFLFFQFLLLPASASSGAAHARVWTAEGAGTPRAWDLAINPSIAWQSNPVDSQTVFAASQVA